MEKNMENEMEPGVIIAIGILNNTYIGPKSPYLLPTLGYLDP